MRELCNINITDTSKQSLFDSHSGIQIIVPMNAECFVKSNNDPRLMDFINSKCRTTIDGQIPLWIYKGINNKEKIEKLSGSDIIYDFCKWADVQNKKVFFLGGKSDANTMAVSKIKDLYPSLNIEGFSPSYEPYPFCVQKTEEIQKHISKFKPDIIFVGFGFGKQELWCADNLSFLESQKIGWIICCGGSFEFLSGEIKRAPKLIQNVGLEGVWRLLMEPKLFRLKRLITSLKIFKYAYSK